MSADRQPTHPASESEKAVTEYRAKTIFWLICSAFIAAGFGLLMKSWGWFLIGVPASLIVMRQFLSAAEQKTP